MSPRLILRHWPLWALVASAAMLAVAHAFQTFGGLAPCELCLHQREIYWAALWVALVGVLASRSSRTPAWTFAAVCALLALLFLAEAALAGYHVGVEQHWWPGPQSCTGTGAAASAAALSSLLKGGHVAAPRCDEIAWQWLGVSMAGWNGLAALGLAALSALAVVKGKANV